MLSLSKSTDEWRATTAVKQRALGVPSCQASMAYTGDFSITAHEPFLYSGALIFSSISMACVYAGTACELSVDRALSLSLSLSLSLGSSFRTRIVPAGSARSDVTSKPDSFQSPAAVTKMASTATPPCTTLPLFKKANDDCIAATRRY